MLEAIFGTGTAQKTLLYIVNHGEGHINGIARAFALAPSQVERQLKRLEVGGVLASRQVGNMKMFALHPKLAVRKELQALLEKLLALAPVEESEGYNRGRRRRR